MNDIKVIKFGGTSLKTKEDRKKVICILKDESKKYKLVVIVSAMGRFPDPYATDTLLNNAKNLNLKSKDEIMSCGEVISSHYLCNECINEKMNCSCLNIAENGIKTNDDYGNGNILYVDSNYIYNALKKYDIIIVPGFFGTNKYHYVTSLGRGGSDFSAILIADSLGLNEVTIYSDVQGIFSADPKIISTAKLYENVNISQALQLSLLDVTVIQKKACMWAYNHRIKMILKSTFKKDGQTIVDDNAPLHDFIIVTNDGYYLLDDTNKLTKFSSDLSSIQAHMLFIE